MTASHRRPNRNRVLTFAVAALAAGSLATAPALAAADAPGGCAAAETSPKNTWLSGTIATETDVDWYRFTVHAGRHVQLTLGSLPADYDLALYAGCSTRIASSVRSNREFDEISRFLSAGTYQVRVTGFLGAHSPTPYVLRFRTLAWGIRVLSSTTWTDSSGHVHVAGEVLNTTGEHRGWIQIDASLHGPDGAVLGRAVGYPKVATLAPSARAPFEIVMKKPAGYASASLRVCTPTATGACAAGRVMTPPPIRLAVTGSTSHLDESGRRHDTGLVLNRGTSTAHLARAVVTLYDARGNVKGVGVDLSAPSSIPADASAAYNISTGGSASPNRAVVQATGSSVGCSTRPRYGGGQENMVAPLTRPSAAGRVALTFDMGGRMTPAVEILELLVANGVCATIFPTGSISRTAEGQAALAVIKAHPGLFELGNHTMHHCDLVRGGGGAPGAADAEFCRLLGPSPTEGAVKEELQDGEYWISQYTGMSTHALWRAPYGASNATVRGWAAEVGWTKHVDWDIDTIDWRPVFDGGPTARSMTLKVVNGATSGSIVLMHLGGYETLDALQSMIDGLRSRGFTLTTVSDLAQ